MWRRQREVTSLDGKQRVEFLVHSDGRARFDEFLWTGPLEDYGAEYEGYWKPVSISGYYENLREAQQAALKEVPWLRR